MAVSEPLYGKNPAELAALCAETGLPRFAAGQLARWLYVKHIEDPMLMTDIPAARRALLAERFRQVLTPPERVTESADGTKKYLFRTQQGAYIESAYIPDGDRATLCVSSRAGCIERLERTKGNAYHSGRNTDGAYHILRSGTCNCRNRSNRMEISRHGIGHDNPLHTVCRTS